MENLKTLNLSANEITKDGIKPLISVINCCRLKTLNMSKNLMGDEGVMELIDSLRVSIAGEIVEKLDFSGCKISDKGFMHIV